MTVNPRIPWASEILTRLGIPPNWERLTDMVMWQLAEGGAWNGNIARNNPLNTTYNMPDSIVINDVGVKAYATYEDGINATISTLKLGYYTTILTALINNAPQPIFANVVGRTLWGTQIGDMLGQIANAISIVKGYFSEMTALVIVEPDGQHYWFIPGGKESYWRKIDPNVANALSQNIISDNGLLLNLWLHT